MPVAKGGPLVAAWRIVATAAVMAACSSKGQNRIG